MIKLVLMGTSVFLMPILEGLMESGYEIQAVVTQPDRPVGRKRVVTPTPVKEAALKRDIHVLQPEKIPGSSEMGEITRLTLDLIITTASGRSLPEKLLQVPKLGTISTHASLLSKYQESAPVHYAVMDGREETGVAIMGMIKKMDAGGIYAQEGIPIIKQDDVRTVFEKLSLLGRKLLLEILPNISDGQKSVPQDEPKVTSSPSITREQETVDWHKTVEEIDSQVREMRPQPIVFTTYRDTRWKLLSIEVLAESTDEAPGTTIRKDKKNLWIVCGKQTVLATSELQPAGRERQVVHDSLNGGGQQVQTGQQVK